MAGISRCFSLLNTEDRSNLTLCELNADASDLSPLREGIGSHFFGSLQVTPDSTVPTAYQVTSSPSCTVSRKGYSQDVCDINEQPRVSQTHSGIFPRRSSAIREGILSPELSQALSDTYRSNGKRTPRTLTRLMQQHRESERHRHRGLNASIRELSKKIPGYEETSKETKIVKLQRIINYICHLEGNIQDLCEELGVGVDFKSLFLSPHITKPTAEAKKSPYKHSPKSGKLFSMIKQQASEDPPETQSWPLDQYSEDPHVKISSPTVDSTTDHMIPQPVCVVSLGKDCVPSTISSCKDNGFNMWPASTPRNPHRQPAATLSNAEDSCSMKQPEWLDYSSLLSPPGSSSLADENELTNALSSLDVHPEGINQDSQELILDICNHIVGDVDPTIINVENSGQKYADGIDFHNYAKSFLNKNGNLCGRSHFEKKSCRKDSTGTTLKQLLEDSDTIEVCNVPNNSITNFHQWLSSRSLSPAKQLTPLSSPVARGKRKTTPWISPKFSLTDITSMENSLNSQSCGHLLSPTKYIIPSPHKRHRKSKVNSLLRNKSFVPMRESVFQWDVDENTPKDIDDPKMSNPEMPSVLQTIEPNKTSCIPKSVVASTKILLEINEDQESASVKESPEQSSKNPRVDHRKTSWMNGFMMYSRLHRRKYIDENPGVHTSYISKLMGQDWRKLTPDEQHPYKEKARSYIKHHLLPRSESFEDLE